MGSQSAWQVIAGWKLLAASERRGCRRLGPIVRRALCSRLMTDATSNCELKYTPLLVLLTRSSSCLNFLFHDCITSRPSCQL